MEVVICPNPSEVARLAASKVARVAKVVGPAVVLGVATGSSPVALYEQLAAKQAAGELDLSLASAFALDEYVGLSKGHPESYEVVIRRTVTEPLGLDPARVHVPDGFADDLHAAAQAYEQAITDAGGIDIQIVGVGVNGHIGFNEPGSSLASRTRVKTLAARTREDNARFFPSLDDVPRHCITQGLGTILDAREVLLVAQGAGKAEAIARVIEGPVTSMVPGSILQFHPRVTVILDEDAASQLTLVDYYRVAFGHKPEWQHRLTGV